MCITDLLFIVQITETSYTLSMFCHLSALIDSLLFVLLEFTKRNRISTIVWLFVCLFDGV